MLSSWSSWCCLSLPAKKRKIVLNFEETFIIIEEYDHIEVASLDIDILRVANRIEKELEMHDRLTVASALYYNALLRLRKIV